MLRKSNKNPTNINFGAKKFLTKIKNKCSIHKLSDIKIKILYSTQVRLTEF